MKLGRDGDAKVGRVGEESRLVAAAVAQVAHGHDAHRGRARRGDQAAHRQQRQARAGHGHAPAHRHHQARADAGDGELHADAHEHAAVRVRVRRNDGARRLLPILKVHGIAVEQLDAPATVTAQAFAVDSVIERGRSETSRMLKDVGGHWNDAARRTLPKGTYVVRAGQPYGLRRSICSSRRARTG